MPNALVIDGKAAVSGDRAQVEECSDCCSGGVCCGLPEDPCDRFSDLVGAVNAVYSIQATSRLEYFDAEFSGGLTGTSVNSVSVDAFQFEGCKPAISGGRAVASIHFVGHNIASGGFVPNGCVFNAEVDTPILPVGPFQANPVFALVTVASGSGFVGTEIGAIRMPTGEPGRTANFSGQVEVQSGCSDWDNPNNPYTELAWGPWADTPNSIDRSLPCQGTGHLELGGWVYDTTSQWSSLGNGSASVELVVSQFGNVMMTQSLSYSVSVVADSCDLPVGLSRSRNNTASPDETMAAWSRTLALPVGRLARSPFKRMLRVPRGTTPSPRDIEIARLVAAHQANDPLHRCKGCGG